ncbi:CrcB family protein [Kaistia dalseonensis]|uniref:Fluoride-specific ion channel FluC n=1 Tax=Kaistia dalseonensis TaxID=410840 RepID=A0ABU0H8P2_9HYPH|nr:CrcB family protein [Kaistia dalseonensis]MCX5496079.1 CrcB family protein [Kaistia dalseonensis]MDQ0438683.1 CrcB protein [Kaistia dalseonensis]
MTPLDLAWVCLGGGLGSLLRWWVGRMVGERYHGDLPVSTLLINVSGAFVIGYLSVRLGVDWRDRYSTAVMAGLLTGGLGGYTTFSTMQLDAATLTRQAPGRAVSYLVISIGAGLAAAALGAALAHVSG